MGQSTLRLQASFFVTRNFPIDHVGTHGDTKTPSLDPPRWHKSTPKMMVAEAPALEQRRLQKPSPGSKFGCLGEDLIRPVSRSPTANVPFQSKQATGALPDLEKASTNRRG